MRESVRHTRTIVKMWWLPTLAVAGLGGACAAVYPAYTAVISLGLGIVVLAFFRPKVFVGFVAFSLLFVRTLISATTLPGIAYLDEIIVVIAIVVLPVNRLLLHGRLRAFPGARWFALFTLFGILSSILATVPLMTLLSGAFLMLKGPLLGWAIAQVDWVKSDLVKIARITGALLILIFLCVAVNIAAPSSWMNLIVGSSTRYNEERFGIPIIIGPFAHPGYFAGLMALAALGLIAYRMHIRRTKLSAALLLGSFASILITFRRKTLVAVASSLIVLPVLTRRIQSAAAIVIALVIGVIVAGDFILDVVQTTYIEYLVDPDRVARIRLTLDSPGVALQHFPWGAGFGRFGSGIARQNYSPEYLALGYPKIWGLGPTEESGKFLTDTFWPAVLGEAGFFGLIAYALALLAIWKFIRRSTPTSREPWTLFLKLTCLLWTIELLVESFAEPVFMSAPIYGIYFGLIGLATSYLSQNWESDVENKKYTVGRAELGRPRRHRDRHSDI
jgi:hypothetical protein